MWPKGDGTFMNGDLRKKPLIIQELLRIPCEELLIGLSVKYVLVSLRHTGAVAVYVRREMMTD